MNIPRYVVLMAGVFTFFSHPVLVKAHIIHCPTLAQIHASKARRSVWHLKAIVQDQQWGVLKLAFTNDKPELQHEPAHVVHYPGEPDFYLVCPYQILNSINLNHTEVAFSSPPQTGYTHCTLDQPERLSMTCY
ncbi:MAG TPA: hypothetical protein VMW10_00930 [Alphaproteobacteria bacterium]|nr:hypothetical protein [Alphaproteobacteria bacterium]